LYGHYDLFTDLYTGFCVLAGKLLVQAFQQTIICPIWLSVALVAGGSTKVLLPVRLAPSQARSWAKFWPCSGAFIFSRWPKNKNVHTKSSSQGIKLTNFEATAQAAQAIRGSILLKMAIIQNATLASVVVGGRVDVHRWGGLFPHQFWGPTGTD
jgi:hypothetical protein